MKTKAGKSGTKKKVPFYATLPPSVAEICQGTDMTPPEVFVAVINHIKAKGTTPTQGTVEAEEVVTDKGTDPRRTREQNRNPHSYRRWAKTIWTYCYSFGHPTISEMR